MSNDNQNDGKFESSNFVSNQSNEEFVKCKKKLNKLSPRKRQLINGSSSFDNVQDLKSNTNSTVAKSNPFTVTIEINFTAWLLFFIALCFRLYLIGYPSNIVFDELHYGKFLSFYIKDVFYFDAQPPLGKQLFAIAGYLAGYDGNNEFTEIGAKYNDNVPLKTLRFVSCLFGSLIVPTTYHVVVELGFSHYTATLASIFVTLENSLLTQSRFILMDSILLFMINFGLFAIIKFRKKKTFSLSWFSWLFVSTTFLTFGLCVKFIGLLSLFIALFIVSYDFWYILPNKAIKTSKLWLQSFVYFVSFIIWPMLIYSTIFYIHLSTLTKAGPHDNVMTSAFQASLDGGLASITKGQPLEIIHGSQITLRHTHGRTCWLHSHSQVYPVKYADGRGSSHQQQVTCYSFKDVNNWWIVKRPNNNDLIVSEPRDRIKHGDIIQLIHGMSSRTLNSHDVAAPITPQNQEVSCYIDYNISMPAQNLWKVDLINKEETNNFWHTIRSKVRLIHFKSSQALKFTGKQLPDWAFNQHEIVTDKLINQDDTIWNVEEHRYTKLSDQKERERDMIGAEFVPLAPTYLSFWEKMKELQYKMLTFDQENIPDHMFANESPIDWLFLTKGIAYWIDPNSNSQIHLIGNFVLWHISTFSIFVYCGLSLFYLLRQKRKIYDLPEDDWNSFVNLGLFFVLSYFVYLLPHFFCEKTLFLHHYFPSLLFKLMLAAALIEHLTIYIKYRYIIFLIVSSILLSSFYCFYKFLPFTYGTGSLTGQQINDLKWVKTWNFIVHK